MSKPPASTQEQKPQHIAIIMDGNGRWAKQRGQPRLKGHQAGAESVRIITELCVEMGISYLTLYAFSSENWKRPKHEIKALMKLLERFLIEKTPVMLKENIRLHTIGDTTAFPESTQKQIAKSCALTAENDTLHLILALNYGARQEITHACKKIARSVASGTLDLENIDAQSISQNLYTSPFPDPDLLIRTSGECRLSNFLLWQLSYAELHITTTLWPDFRKKDFLLALQDYADRDRRYGGIK